MRTPVALTPLLALLGLSVPLRAQASFGLAFGPDDFVAVPASASLNSIAGAITVEAWVKLTGTTSRPTVVRRNTSLPFGAPQIYILRVDDVFATTMELAFYVVNDAVFATVPLSLGTWHHIAGTLSGTETRIYWDGQVVGTGAHSGGIPASGAPLRIGIGETFEPWLGEVDEVRLWNLARTPAEVQSFMSSPLAGSEPGLVGYWKFDEGAGQSASDMSSAGNHGVLGASVAPDPNDPT